MERYRWVQIKKERSRVKEMNKEKGISYKEQSHRPIRNLDYLLLFCIYYTFHLANHLNSAF